MNSLRRRCSWLLLPIVANRNISTKASVSAKIQWRAYFSFGSNQIRYTIKESKISCPSTRRRFSSSSSSKSGIGFVGWYMRKLDTQPFITKSISSSLIYVAADLTSQMITLPSPGSFDLIRTTRMAAYGMLILGPSQHLWFNFMSTISPSRDLLSTFKKIFLGQAVLLMTATWLHQAHDFIDNEILQLYGGLLWGLRLSPRMETLIKCGPSENGSEIAARLKRDLLPTLLNGLLFWPVCDFLTYKFVPVHLQPLANSSFAYIWTIYLTYMASLKGVDIN